MAWDRQRSVMACVFEDDRASGYVMSVGPRGEFVVTVGEHVGGERWDRYPSGDLGPWL